MRRFLPIELVYQVFSLLVAFIVVHSVYVAVVRHNAAADMAEQAAKLELDPKHQPERSYYVVIKDYEQESCFVLMLWALAILAFKGTVVYRQQRQLNLDLVGLPEDALVTVDSTRQATEMIRRRLPPKTLYYLLPRVLLASIDRFSTTRSVQDASGVVQMMCDAEAERTESELSIIRYIAWAIPSVGFIGTVRGIGDALALHYGQQHELPRR